MLFNPVIISVIVLVILCLCKMHVLLALIVSALIAGIVGGMNITDTMSTLVGGMGGNAETALSYVLLGVLAAGMASTGITDILSRLIARSVGNNKMILFIILTVIACMSQFVIPVHIAFIPILIPPLLAMMNRMKIDRRAVACCLAFGLKAPYIAVPLGFGLIFQGLIASNLTQNGVTVLDGDVWKSTWYLGASMIIGLIVALIVFSKPREYKIDAAAEKALALDSDERIGLNKAHWVALLAAVVTMVCQLLTSMPLGAFSGVIVLILGGAIKWTSMDDALRDGMGIMGIIAFVMLIASGYGAVIRATGAVDGLVAASLGIVGGSELVAAIVLMVIGLVITIGIGSSFGTIPILAVLYAPFCAQVGFSVEATIILIAAAAALGDAGSPASDTTLGPTAGLNADGQHDHIWDTCVPTGIIYNAAIAVTAIVLSQVI